MSSNTSLNNAANTSGQASRTVVAVFDSASAANRAVEELLESGFRREDIEVTAGDSSSDSSLASSSAIGNTGLSGRQPSDTSGGGITGFFKKMFGGDDDYSGHYDEAVQRGSTVVTVNTNNEEVAADILDRNGAIDVDEQAASWRASGNYGTTTDRSVTGDQSIPVVREELRVGKREVLRGGVRVHNRIVEQPVEEQIRLREEHVRVDRRPVDRAATEADFRNRNEVIEVTETAEEAVVSKSARVVEEVVIGKEATDRTETVRDTVRHTDIDVERIPAGASASDYDTDYREDFRTRYGSVSGATYETYAPFYQYGSRMASNDRYRGRSWSEVESDLQRDYETSYPSGNWERMKDSIRYGWEKVTGRR